MGGDALQIPAAHTAMVAMAYLTDIMSSVLTHKAIGEARASLGRGSRPEAGPATRSWSWITEGPRSAGARSVFKVLGYLLERGDYDELHKVIERQARQIKTIQGSKHRARHH